MFAFTLIVDLPLFARLLRVHIPITPYKHIHSALHSCLQKSGIWWMKMWQVIMLLSLAACFELSPTHALTLARQGFISLSCESDKWKPKGRKRTSWRADLKDLVVFAQGYLLWYLLPALSFMHFCPPVMDELSCWHPYFPTGNEQADCEVITAKQDLLLYWGPQWLLLVL